MRLALGDAQSFADAPSLLAYCAANPNLHAGYAPMGQPNPQTLPCQEWPYILGKGQTIVVSGGSTSSISLASTTVFGIPLWVLAVGALGLLLYMRRHG
jgi:hypothetical protein